MKSTLKKLFSVLFALAMAFGLIATAALIAAPSVASAAPAAPSETIGEPSDLVGVPSDAINSPQPSPEAPTPNRPYPDNLPSAIKTFTVKFNSRDGAGTMPDQLFFYDVPQPLVANRFTRQNFHLEGWATSPTGAKVYDDKEVVSNLSSDDKAIVNLYAVWKINQYTIHFEIPAKMQATVMQYNTPMGTQTLAYGEQANLLQNTYIRKGCSFVGWATSQYGPKVYYNTQVVKNLSNVDGGVVILYTVWKENSFTAHFKPNGGTGTMADQNFVCYQSQTLNANTFKSPPGHVFVGWSVSPSGSVKYKDKDDLELYPTVNCTTVNLYAQWAKYYAEVQTYYDHGYHTWFDESEGESKANLGGYINDLANRYFTLVKLNIKKVGPQYHYSAIDKCKETVTKDNIDLLCDHSGTAHTLYVPDGMNVFKSERPGSETVTTAYWTAHRVQCDFNAKELDENRCGSSGYSIAMLDRPLSEDRYINSTGILMHELNHQYGVGDHYHEELKDTPCRSGDKCSFCGINRRPETCVMNRSRQDINEETIMCDECLTDIKTHLNKHHKY